jgi:hypothetical protein
MIIVFYQQKKQITIYLKILLFQKKLNKLNKEKKKKEIFLENYLKNIELKIID